MQTHIPIIGKTFTKPIWQFRPRYYGLKENNKTTKQQGCVCGVTNALYLANFCIIQMFCFV